MLAGLIFRSLLVVKYSDHDVRLVRTHVGKVMDSDPLRTGESIAASLERPSKAERRVVYCSLETAAVIIARLVENEAIFECGIELLKVLDRDA